MQGRDYIFCFQNEDNKFWSINASGNVVLSSQPYFLEFSPSGWDELAIQNVINKAYWALDRTVSVPLAYIKDGARILKHIFYNYGTDTMKTYFTIARQQLHFVPNTEYGYWYKQIFRAEVDFSTLTDTGVRFNVSMLEEGLPKYLKANERTMQEIVYDDYIWVKMDGINLRNKVDTLVSNGLGDDVNFEFRNHVVDLMIVQEDAPYVSGKKAVTRAVRLTANEAVTAGDWFMKSSVPGVVQIDYDFEIKLEFVGGNPSPVATYRLFVGKKTTGPAFSDGYDLWSIGTSGGSSRFNQTSRRAGTLTIPVDEGDELYLYSLCTVIGAGGDAQLKVTYTAVGESLFNYSYKYRHPESYVKAMRPNTLFGKLINVVTEGRYSSVNGAYLSTMKKNIVFTCGNAIRGLDDAVIKTSFSDFFSFWNSYDDVGMRVVPNNGVDIDRKANLTQSAPVSLGRPSNDTFKVTIAKEFLWNVIDIGYPEVKNDVGVLNGSQEFNSKFQYSIGATISPATVNKISPVKASCYEIEQIRVMTFQKDTTDYKSDNDVFVLHINPELQPGNGDDIPDHYLLDRTLNASATGLLEPETVFNIELSPKRNLLRNGSFLRSSMYRSDGKLLEFTYADKNSELKCDGITERDSVTLGDIGDIYFHPVYLEGEFDAPDNINELLDANPLTVFEIDIDNNVFKGFVMKSSIAPSKRNTQSFQLLSHPDNDLTKLIEYNG